LKSHEDSYCPRTGSSNWQWNGEAREISAALGQAGLRAPDRFDGIAILDRTPSGRAATLLLSGGESIRISAGSFRFAVGRTLGWNTIRSDRYSVRSSNGRVMFQGSGSGHGVGLCQDGAEQMGLVGKSYREILGFYFPGAMAGLTGSGLAWQRLGSESITLWTTQPDQDRATLAVAERLAKGAAQRTGFPIPAGIEVRAYPDVETFRNATAEPGWVAAHTARRRIDMQPAAVLRGRVALEPTLFHELLHVLIESQAGPALPLWFREGLVNYLAGEREPAAARAVSDTELRQTGDPEAARRAYAQSTAMVRSLAIRYGETSVLNWVSRGLPPEVARPNTSQPATKSK
jgi:stage II sporulation protein D